MSKPRDGSPRLFAGVAASVVVVAGVLAALGQIAFWDGVNNLWQAVVPIGLVYVLQRNQDRDTAAIHLKLDVLVRAVPDASNDVAGIEQRDVPP